MELWDSSLGKLDVICPVFSCIEHVDSTPVTWLIFLCCLHVQKEHRKVCVNILQDRAASGYSVSNLGGE